MSLLDVIKYNNTLVPNGDCTLADVYGKEKFCYLVYSLVKMQQPQTILELGTGLGTTALMIAQALKENEKGKIYTVDNGKDWDFLKTYLYTNSKTHKDYFNNLTKKLEVNKYIELLTQDLSQNILVKLKERVDLLFYDATDTGALGCIDALTNYLPKMNSESSIFIDRASTINHSYLLLEKIIKDLQNNKIPNILVNKLSNKEEEKLRKFVSKTKFTLVHLPEKNDKKINKLQNSTAWIKLEPVDVLFQNNVSNLL